MSVSPISQIDTKILTLNHNGLKCYEILDLYWELEADLELLKYFFPIKWVWKIVELVILCTYPIVKKTMDLK